jgi:hypothetical protein
MDEALRRHGEEAAVTGDAHDRLRDAERDQLGVRDPSPRVPSCLWQKIVGCAIDDRAERAEVGVHRGLRADGVLGTVDFGLSALLSLEQAQSRGINHLAWSQDLALATSTVDVGPLRLAASCPRSQ